MCAFLCNALTVLAKNSARKSWFSTNLAPAARPILKAEIEAQIYKLDSASIVLPILSVTNE